MRRFDAVVIGFGKGGKTLAGALGAAGRSVAVVERDERMYGGTCINVACIPTKSLVNSAALSAAQGGTFDERAERYAAAIAEKERLTSFLRGKNLHKLADMPTVEVILGSASFVDGHHIAVAGPDGATETLEAGQVFIDTGARPVVPSIPGLAVGGHVHTSETLLDHVQLPHEMVVIGGGYIGLEFASMYAAFGAHVTVVQPGEVFLPREDAEIAASVLASLEARDVEVLRSTEVLRVDDGPAGAVVAVRTPEGERSLVADVVLVATGRAPETTGLALEAAGVEVDRRGAIVVDDHLRTTAPDIWAMGDVTGGLQFTYISLDDYRIVRSQVLGGRRGHTTADRGAVPYSVFLAPAFSRVGLTEREARDQGIDVKVARMPAAAIPKAQVLRHPVGLLKVIVDADTDLIVGAHLFCEESYEMVNLVKLAMDAGQPYTVLRDAIYTHPTMSEALNDLLAQID